MKIFGLIGYPLSHSFSKGYFAEKFSKEGLQDSSYQNFELEHIDLFPKLLSENDISGLNVTIPYKEQVIAFLDDLHPTAKEIGAVNTIRVKNEKLTGFNTDVIGFVNSLIPMLDGADHDQINALKWINSHISSFLMVPFRSASIFLNSAANASGVSCRVPGVRVILSATRRAMFSRALLRTSRTL